MNTGEVLKIVELFPVGTTDGGARTSDAICLKNVIRCTLVLGSYGGAAAAVTWTPRQATDVAIGTTKALSVVCPIWHNDDTSADDTLDAETAAVAYATAAAAANTITVIQVDPDTLDVDGGYDCLYVLTSGASASNLIAGYALCEMRYQGDSSPSVIVD